MTMDTKIEMLDMATAYLVSNLKNAKHTGITTPPALSPPVLASIIMKMQKNEPINSRDCIGNMSLCLQMLITLSLNDVGPHHSQNDSQSSLELHFFP